MKVPILFCVLCLTIWPLAMPREGTEKSMGISLVQLLATPERFDGKVVRVIGYLAMGERAALYIHREDADHGLDSNAVGLIPSKQMIRNENELNGMYVWMVGKVRTTPTEGGRLQIQIYDISECSVWSDPNRPKSGRSDDSSAPRVRPK